MVACRRGGSASRRRIHTLVHYSRVGYRACVSSFCRYVPLSFGERLNSGKPSSPSARTYHLYDVVRRISNLHSCESGIMIPMKIFLHWLIAAAAIGIAAYIVPGVTIDPISALIAAVVLGALNLFIRPIIVILTLPINVVTLGLFSLVINASLVLLATYLVPGFVIIGFWTAVLFAIVLSVVNWVFHLWNRD